MSDAAPPPLLDLATLRLAPLPRSGCFTCKHLRRETESWEMPQIAWYECDKRPQNSNLRNFPFRSTACAVREPR
jgi:hypothetical protein